MIYLGVCVPLAAFPNMLARNRRIKKDQMIYLFSSITCPPCAQAKDYLTKKGIDYTVIDIDDNPQEAKKHKIRTIPTLLVIHEGEKHYIQSWHRNQYLALLKKTGKIKGE